MKLLYLPGSGFCSPSAKPRLFCECGREHENAVSISIELNAGGVKVARLELLDPDVQIINAPPAPAADDAADARRLRWLLAGNGYFMEHAMLCGHGPCTEAEQNEARAKIDAEMKERP